MQDLTIGTSIDSGEAVERDVSFPEGNNPAATLLERIVLNAIVGALGDISVTQSGDDELTVAFEVEEVPTEITVAIPEGAHPDAIAAVVGTWGPGTLVETYAPILVRA